MHRVLHYVALMNRGGEETFIMNVFRAIDRNVISFDFLCCLPGIGDYDSEIAELGGEVHHIELSKLHSKFKQIANFYILYKYLKAHNKKYDAFHIHTQHAMDGFKDALAAKLAGIPIVIVHSHSTSTLFHVKAHKLFRGFLNNLPITKLACSELAGKWLYGENGKFEVVRNGVDVEKYRYHNAVRESIREKNEWNDKIIIGHVGNFTYPKNHEFIIDVFNAYCKEEPKAHLVFAGKGELMNSAKAKCEGLGIIDRVTFLGMREDVEVLDQGYDLMLFPSRYEGLPVVLVEAQCTGLPCLISDTITQEVDITDLVSRLNIENDDITIWVDTIKEMLVEFKHYRRGDAAQAVYDNRYSMNDTVNRLMEIYCSYHGGK